MRTRTKYADVSIDKYIQLQIQYIRIERIKNLFVAADFLQNGFLVQ